VSAVARQRPLVLCCHAVSETWGHELAVDPSVLEQHLTRILGRGFRPVTALEAVTSGGRTVHVTFDDAFRSVELALPLLERLGVPATVFACTDYAEDGRRLAVGDLGADRTAPDDETSTMRWDDLRGLVERGVAVGSHTVTHPHLTELSDEELDRELVTSKQQLEDELGRECATLAYPFGDEDPRVRAAAKRAGYAAAFSLTSRPLPLDPFGVPRVGVYRKDTPSRVRLKSSLPGLNAAALRGALRR
jgi:peptidoglycan/xylan/chitin deacetylase (PgdA/CDA1 family)